MPKKAKKIKNLNSKNVQKMNSEPENVQKMDTEPENVLPIQPPLGMSTIRPIYYFPNAMVQPMSISNYNQMNMTQTQLMNLARMPLMNMTQTPLMNMTRMPLMNMAQRPLMNMTHTPLMNMTQTPLMNMTQRPLMNMTQTPLMNMQISQTQCTPINSTQQTASVQLPSTNSNSIDQPLPNCVEFMSTQQSKKKKSAPSVAYLNEIAHKIRVDLSDSGKYVLWSEIITELLKKYEAEKLSELGLKRSDDLQTISDLLYTQKCIDTFLVYYDKVMPYSTIYELENQLAKYFKKDHFS